MLYSLIDKVENGIIQLNNTSNILIQEEKNKYREEK